MKSILHKSEERGHANHGWLKAKHSFSFASWYDPQKIHFGMLRVLNDDIVAPGMGFGTHPHDNMEICTIPLEGALEHKDSMGHTSVIKPGEVQVMSAGTGVTHSEYNASKTEEVKLLQIWIFPRKRDLKPRYDQKTYKAGEDFTVIVSPDQANADVVYLNQDTWFSIAQPDSNKELTYKTHLANNGVYFFLIEGSAVIGEHSLKTRDAVGVWEAETVPVKLDSGSRLLAIEVPMN